MKFNMFMQFQPDKMRSILKTFGTVKSEFALNTTRQVDVKVFWEA